MFICGPQFNWGVRQHPVNCNKFHTTSSHQVHVIVRASVEKHTASHRRQHGAQSKVRSHIQVFSQQLPKQKQTFFSFAVPPLVALPTLHLHTVLAPRRRTVSPVEPPVAAHSMGPSLETGAAPPTMAPQLHLHCPMTQGLLLSNAGAHLQGLSARSPQSLSAGQSRKIIFLKVLLKTMDPNASVCH